ncbi:hypothetical protein P691DRAFT_796801 [Macrolepiota fuliginosa MF-IS2]|uniref:Uncharacterized protein n=1 Tax=Macrolepiota fuliginosa MF-IS2 TaxID=1400762 RepID=A0A9P5X488_9AGAR|nr:hypothetical protein P691DRAFT_796801 [Macrolepiota fuliginosa MF-IS2]
MTKTMRTYEYKVSQFAKKLDIQRTHERQAKEAENRASVVLGTRAHEEAELCPTETLEISELGMSVRVPGDTNYGIGQVEEGILFEELPKETAKLDAFSKLINLQNANAKGIAYENKREIILEFSTPSNPFDPGAPRFKVHLTTFKSDLIHRRAKILHYLNSKDQDRYEVILPRPALEPGSVDGELVI